MSSNIFDLPIEILEMIMSGLDNLSILALLLCCRKLLDKLHYTTQKLFPKLLDACEFTDIDYSDILLYLQRHSHPLCESHPERFQVDLTSRDVHESRRFKRVQDRSLFLKNYSYSFSEKLMVLVISDEASPWSILHIWDLKKQTQLKSMNHPLRDLKVEPQEILMHEHCLITCGMIGGWNSLNLIQILDVRTGKYATFSASDQSAIRVPATFRSSSSANRVFAFQNKVLCCLDFMLVEGGFKQFRLFFLKIPDDFTVDLEIEKLHIVPEVYMDGESSSYFACDQKLHHLVLGFSHVYQGERNQQFVLVNLDDFSVRTLMMPEFTPVKHIGIPIDSMQDTYFGTRIDCLVATSPTHFSILDGERNTFITPRYTKNVKVQSHVNIVGNRSNEYTRESLFENFYDELHMYAEFVITLHSTTKPRSKDTCISVYNLDGQIIHCIAKSIRGSDMLQRLYLKPSFGLLCLSNATQVWFYSLLTGQLISSHSYLSYRRNKEQETDFTERDYSQSGYSVWELRCFKDSLVVVYDLERVNPLFFDLYPLKVKDCNKSTERSEHSIKLRLSDALETTELYRS